MTTELLQNPTHTASDLLVQLTDAEGQTFDAVLQDVLVVEFEGETRDYAILLPEQDPNVDGVAAIITRFVEEPIDGESHFIEINSESEFSHVRQTVQEYYSDTQAA